MLLGTWDWVVLGSVISLSLAISVIVAIIQRRKTDENEFLLGSRNMPLLPTAVSLMASFLSSILILGYPADTFQQGVSFLLFVFGEVIGGFLALFFVVPFFYNLQLTSIYEYLEMRFTSKALRVLGSLVGILYQVIYVGVCIYGPATVFSFYTDYETWKVILIMGAISTIPTAVGGLRAVIWMDLFQAIIMYGMIFAILVSGYIKIGSVAEVTSLFFRNHAQVSLSISPLTTYTLYSAIIGGITTWAGHFAFSQSSVQRYSSLASRKLAYTSVILGNFITFFGFLLACLLGIVIYSYYLRVGCNPLTHPLVKNANQLVAFFLRDVLNFPAVHGLFVAALIAGGFSSITSSLTSIAANLWSDILEPCVTVKNKLKRNLIIRCTVFFGGLLGTFVAYGVIGAGGTIIRLIAAFINAITGPLVGVFLLGGIFRFTEKIGAIIGLLIGLSFNLWLAVGSYLYVVRRSTIPPGNFSSSQCFDMNVTTGSSTDSNATPSISSVYNLSFLWYGFYGTTITLMIGTIISAIVTRCKSSPIPNEFLLTCCGHRCQSLNKTPATSSSVTSQDNSTPLLVRFENDCSFPTEKVNGEERTCINKREHSL